MAKKDKKEKDKESKAKAKEAPIAKDTPEHHGPMPAGTHEKPGPINDPADHPANNIPAASDPRWRDVLNQIGPQAMQAGQGDM